MNEFANGLCINNFTPIILFHSKPNLKLEPKEKLGDIILVVSFKPAITINLKPG